MKQTFWLPWPPSLNRAYRAVDGTVLLSEVGRRYVKKVVNALPKGPIVSLEGRLCVTYSLQAPRTQRGRWDIANREKLLSDALTKARVWLDDSQIDELLIRRGEPFDKGGVVVTIEEHANGS